MHGRTVVVVKWRYGYPLTSMPLVRLSLLWHQKAKFLLRTWSKAINAINDGLLPRDEFDRSAPYYHWWPKEGTTEWISYTFNSPKTLSRSTVYWYDDAPWGGCRVPEWWKLYYKNSANQWVEVESANQYGTEKGVGNEVIFARYHSRDEIGSETSRR